MSKIVVTGGAGFIGSNLVRALLTAGKENIIALDNLNSGKESNLKEIKDQVKLVVADIRDYDAIAPVIAGADLVIHLAALPSVPRSIIDPIPSHEVNINGTFNVYRAAKEGKVRRV